MSNDVTGEAMPQNLTQAIIYYENLQKEANASDDDAAHDRVTAVWDDIKTGVYPARTADEMNALLDVMVDEAEGSSGPFIGLIAAQAKRFIATLAAVSEVVG